MLEEGYAGRAFADVLLDTRQDDFAATICKVGDGDQAPVLDSAG
jgi:hypothetical protein